MFLKLAATALLSLAVGAGGTYATLATIRVTASCAAATPAPADDGMKVFLAKPDAPLNGYPRY